MKPSERIEQIREENQKLDSSEEMVIKLPIPEAIKMYLDEQAEKAILPNGKNDKFTGEKVYGYGIYPITKTLEEVLAVIPGETCFDRGFDSAVGLTIEAITELYNQ